MDEKELFKNTTTPRINAQLQSYYSRQNLYDLFTTDQIQVGIYLVISTIAIIAFWIYLNRYLQKKKDRYAMMEELSSTQETNDIVPMPSLGGRMLLVDPPKPDAESSSTNSSSDYEFSHKGQIKLKKHRARLARNYNKLNENLDPQTLKMVGAQNLINIKSLNLED